MLGRWSSGVVMAAVGAAVFGLSPAALAGQQSGDSNTLKVVQLSGARLKSGLLPPGDFVRGYGAFNETDSGRALEHGRGRNISSLSCSSLWGQFGTSKGFGETAFATDLVENPPGSGSASPGQLFDQSVYQFSGAGTAASFYSAVDARFAKCHSVTESDSGVSLRITVRSQSAVRVGNHRAFQLVASVGPEGGPGPALRIYELLAVDGNDVYYEGYSLT